MKNSFLKNKSIKSF